MSTLQSTLINTINNLNEEKQLKILSYAMYLQNEPEYELEFSAEEEREIMEALAGDERIESSVVEKRFVDA